MITYLYWLAVIAVSGAVLYGLGHVAKHWKAALILGGIVMLVGWGAYYFRFQQIFVKRYGGVMTIHVPEGQYHLSATWKDDNLWVENYDPKTNSCIFSEYSRGNLLQGRVFIKDCNPWPLSR